MKKLFTLVMLGVLFVALCFTMFPQFSVFYPATASSTLPVDDAESANGTIAVPNSYCLIWYDWVNVSGTQVMNYVLYTNSDYPYPTPIANLVGQHFQLTDGTEVFVVSALDKMEVYRDQNGDGIPQANFTSGDSEILYYMYVNMSDSYSMVPIQKTMEGDVPHYQWGFTYVNVYAYLQNATVRYGVVAKLIFDHITLSYDFSLNDNVSSLKTSFDIGKVVSVDVLDSSQFSLDGLSLALLYPTSTYASKPYSTYVNGQLYNSTTANDSAVNAELARVAVGDTKAYDFVFGGNYTLIRGENIETYETKAEAAALSSVPTEAYGPVVWQTSFFRDELNLNDLFGGSWPDVTIDYSASSLIYRVCFPVWDGLQIQHDPVYVGYLFSSAPIGILGDLNRDGTVNILDAILLANAFNSKPGDSNWNPNADLNGDNVVNVLDAILLANHLGQTV
jgi:hypothetical protein